jgi:Hint domain-containing protein
LARTPAQATQATIAAFSLVRFWEKYFGPGRNREDKKMPFFWGRRWLAVVPVFLSLTTQKIQQGPVVIQTGQTGTSARLDEGKPQAEPPDPVVKIEVISFPDLRYRLMERFGPLFLCGEPVPNPGRERRAAIRGFPDIVKETAAFQAMARHLGFDKVAEFSDDQKILLYSEYEKLLRAMKLDSQGDSVRFEVRVLKASPKPVWINGFRITGLVDTRGAVTISDRMPEVLTCPVCLAAGTRIDTPLGPIPVEELRPDVLVWTLDLQNQRVARPILIVNSVPVAPGHLVIHLSLSDGRELWVSPGHPTVDGRQVDQLMSGGEYDGAVIQSTRLERYTGERTFDLLVAGNTGFYWAIGILLASTLRLSSSAQLPFR